MSDYEILVASDVDREEVFVEVIYEGEVIAEVTKQDGRKMITIFSPRNGVSTSHVGRDLIAALAQAEKNI